MNLAYDTLTDFSLIQTFYADPESVNNSGEVSITSVDLFFKNKPPVIGNASGKANPGVTVRLCEVVNDQPDLSKVLYGQISYKTREEIFAFADASSATTFGFNTPVKIRTGRFYGIVVIFEDVGYELWTNKTGDKLVGTSTISPGSSTNKDGKLFLKNNANQFRSLSDTDLKFNLKCAQYAANTLNEVFVNREYEFLSLNNITNRFVGGEYVFQNTANATGNISFSTNTNVIVGSGTAFDTVLSDGDRIVLFTNSTYQQLVSVQNVVNSSYIITSTTLTGSNNNTKFMIPPSGKVHNFDPILKKLILVDSSANSTVKFAANSSVLVGEDSRATANISSIDAFSVDRVRLKTDFDTPPAGTIVNTLNFAQYDGTTYTYNGTNSQPVKLNLEEMFNITQYDAYILSRSLEVGISTLASNTDLLYTNKSATVNTDIAIRLSNTDLFQSPTINSDKLDMFVVQNYISNTYTRLDANNVVIDTEVAGNGLALSRHISKKVTFANSRFAEDVRVFMNAYRPAGTQLLVYARLFNSNDSDAFDDKSWTPLEYKENGNKYSASDNQNDVIEYTLGLPLYPESANVIPGTFTTTLSNNIIVAAGVTPNTHVATNDLVKIYNPLIPENYIVDVVTAANSTAITLGSPISNNNLVGFGFQVDRLKYYNTAFNNITNDNVARYYSSTLVQFDTFDSMQYKIVFLSDSTYRVPRVDSVTFIGVSA